jgi:DNA-directed RNA polymerase subunit RPC12/RpoP
MKTHSMGNVAQLLTTCFDCGSEATLEQLDYDQRCNDCAEQIELDKQ